MSLNQGEKILAEDFISLKSRVEAECSRRSVSNNIPTIKTSDKILPAHVNALLTPLRTINSTKVTQDDVVQGELIKSISSIDASLNYFETKNAQSNNSGCASGCMGMCQGCTGACLDTCTGTCKGGCTGTCTGGCDGCSSCWNQCSGCGDGCTDSCQQNCAICTTSCGTLCGNTCQGDCTGACKSTCSGHCTLTSN